MKPVAKPIDPGKHSEVPPAPELTRESADMIRRVFLAMLLLPMMFEISAWISPSRVNLLAAGVRSGTQWLLTNILHEGNRAVFVGREGRLFDMRELDRIVDLKRAGAPASKQITDFAADLRQRGIPLVLVTVPERVTLYPDGVRGTKYRDAVRSTGEKARLDTLRASGIEIIDVTEPLWEMRIKKEPFFKQSRHWTPEAMKATALLIEKHIREKHRALALDDTPLIKATIVTQRDAGDLARQLDPLLPSIQLGEEEMELLSVDGVEFDEKSPVLLLGGDLIRIFDDPALGFGGDSQAGLMTQMALLLCRPIDVSLWPLAGPAKLEGKQLVILVLPMSEVLP
ncbi:MAG: hypothetical protein HS117_06530 [Verrucomicrobiaceae bacterium]|nr:hypothetical protein [Verrucomicrobiaceae bacterium]